MFGIYPTLKTQHAYKGRCFAYVVATVPRANQGAYHPDLNPYGTREYWVNTLGSNGTWDDPRFVSSDYLKTTRDCFNYHFGGVPTVTGSVSHDYSGNIATGRSGRPDGIFYDGIEAGGLNGVIDWRLPDYASDSPEEAAKVWEKVKNKTYRGLEKLVTSGWMFSDVVQPVNNATSNWLKVPVDKFSGDVSVFSGNSSVTGRYGSICDAEGNVYKITAVYRTTADELWLANESKSTWPTSTTYTGVLQIETNLSVSGVFNTQMVIGDPANILQTDAFKDGWLGTWCPVIPDGTAQEFPLTKKLISATNTPITWTNDYGGVWSVSPMTFSGVRNERSSTVAANGVQICTYTAYAKQTKPSTNKPVLNGTAGLLGVITTQDHDKATFAESVADVILKSDSSGIVTEQSQPIKYLVDGVIERIKTLQTDLVSPSNESQAIKVAVYQISQNGQLFLGFVANTMTHNGTDWGELDEIIIPFGSLEVDSFNDANGIAQLAYSTMTALPYGWTKNRARAGEQIEGVDL